jgi:hypothetical protein
VDLRPVCQRLRRLVTSRAPEEEVEPMNFHDVSATRARQAVSSATVAVVTREPPAPGMELCCLQAARRTPRATLHPPRRPRRRMCHDHLRSGTMSSAAASTLLDHMVNPLWISPRTPKASKRDVTLVGIRHICKSGLELLLTQLEVRAPPVLRTASHRLPQQKPWRVRNCF